MKTAEIWLVDTSIAPLYHGGKKPPFRTRSQALKASWDGYVARLVAEAAPKHVICIGKGVEIAIGKSLRRMLGAERIAVLPQPNAHLSAAKHLASYQTCYRVCSEHCGL